MDELELHPSSRVLIDRTKEHLPQSLLISGQSGVGINTIINAMAHSVTSNPIKLLPTKDGKIDAEKGTISVDSIRELIIDTRTKQYSKRVVIIDYADKMGIQAQNAFLKLLEEPNDSTYFILGAHTPEKLLPTILSRTQRIDIRPISRSQTDSFIETLGVKDATKKLQLKFMAEGLPAEIVRLIHDENYFIERSKLIRDARMLLQGEVYERLQVIQQYKEDRSKILLLLQFAIRILQSSMSKAPQVSILKQVNRVLFAYDKIEANGNIRLCLTRLVL